MTDRTGRRAPRPNYGSKRRVRRDGYIDVYEPTHPLARRDGYLMEHRKMAWDAGLFSNPALQVHHVNEVRSDNRLENFEILGAAEHTKRHIAERGTISNQWGTFPLRAEDDPRRFRAERLERRSAGLDPCRTCGQPIEVERQLNARHCLRCGY